MHRSRAILITALVFSTSQCLAQSCPAGTILTRVEERAGERIVHCAKSQYGPDAAMRLLRKSDLGRSIADFLDSHKIPIKVAKGPVDPSVGGTYDRGKREILLPQNALTRDAVGLAVTLAHEGYHAREAVERGMLPCIENEQDAFFVQFVVYVEMTRNGVPRVADDDPIAGDLKFFKKAVKSGALGLANRGVERVYSSRRKTLMHIGDWLRPLGRLLVGFGLRVSDAVWDLTEDFETLDQKERHLAYWWNKMPVKRSRAAHAENIEWKRKWIDEHRRDDFSGS